MLFLRGTEFLADKCEVAMDGLERHLLLELKQGTLLLKTVGLHGNTTLQLSIKTMEERNTGGEAGQK